MKRDSTLLLTKHRLIQGALIVRTWEVRCLAVHSCNLTGTGTETKARRLSQIGHNDEVPTPVLVCATVLPAR